MIIFVRMFVGVIQFATVDRARAFETDEAGRTLRDGVLILAYDEHGNLTEQWRYVDGEWYHF